ncbi:LAME_0B03730g1_1 [Lachancea meyersii CBS 8951]|uniref:LAME_0B03730g1_1 n=1 Tax=Lachancea meyersii CBS 8951 TaxID=1266667 RepID=A0A1G4IUI0_9SACH|nr:LAME_0B03730g1_1 [Lachancea meyersii CBS 8951]
MSFENPEPLEIGGNAPSAPPALDGAPVEEISVAAAGADALNEEERESEQEESLYSHDEERFVAEKEDSATPEIQTATNEDENEGLVGAESSKVDPPVNEVMNDNASEIGDAAAYSGQPTSAVEVAHEATSLEVGEELESAQASPKAAAEIEQDDEELADPSISEDSEGSDEVARPEQPHVDEEAEIENAELESEASSADEAQDFEKEESSVADTEGVTSEPQAFDVNNYSTDLESVDYSLLQRQANTVLESQLLDRPQFQRLSDAEKISAVVTLLNANPETALPQRQMAASQTPAMEEGEGRPNLLQPMTAVERKRYNEYLRGENRITEIQNIPPKSRLFIGNLPLKNVAKDDLFRIFSPYGHIYQINIKNAFGFIQYDNPQSVRAAIAGESNELNFGKKLILEISSSNSRPQYDHGDHGTNSSSTFISSSKRPFDEDEDEEDIYSESQKRGKRRVPECQIYVKRTADRSYANDIFGRFRQGTGLETDMIFLKPRMELRKMMNDAAYDGVWGVVLVNKTRNVDIQTFYKGPQGETKFDEYASVSCEDAIAIFNNLKNKRHNMMNIPPQPVPQQQYYGGYNAPPGPVPQGQAYMQQAYGTVAPAPQAYSAPPPGPSMTQNYASYPGHPIPGPPTHISPPPMAPVMGSAPQMDQQQLFSAIQNLPPNVVSNLLSMAQQQPQQQQQLLGIIQSMQPQQAQAQGSPPAPVSYGGFQQMPMGTPPVHHQPQRPSQVPQQQQPAYTAAPKNSPAQNPVPQQQSPSVSGNNNVQSLLDSLAQLQQK